MTQQPELTKQQQWSNTLSEMRYALKELDDAAGEIFNLSIILDELAPGNDWQTNALIDISAAENLVNDIEAEGNPFNGDELIEDMEDEDDFDPNDQIAMGPKDYGI